MFCFRLFKVDICLEISILLILFLDINLRKIVLLKMYIIALSCPIK